MSSGSAGAGGDVPADKDSEQLFKPIDGDASVNEVTEVESYCVNCSENGVTRLMLTRIPFYKEVVLTSFSCTHCNYENNEIQSAGEMQVQGWEYKLQVSEKCDLERQIVKSDYAAVSVPELELEIPCRSQKGEVTTVEGILSRVTEGLKQDQARRLAQSPEEYQQIEDFIAKVAKYMALENGFTFTLVLRDISGNCFISPPPLTNPGQKDPRLTRAHFDRTVEENHILGLYSEAELQDDGTGVSALKLDDVPEDEPETTNLADEVHEFLAACSHCGAEASTRMKVTKIPYFKEVIVMATDCESCGSRTNEVKSGSGIEPKGQRISLEVKDTEDMSRDLLKAETCSIEIPSLDLHVGAGTLGGKFTTLEGILVNIRDQLLESNPMIGGDSVEPEMKEKLEQFATRFERCLTVAEPYTFVLDDPAGNSYLQNVYAPDPDPNMTVEHYERTFEQNEELGLNDINTENYQNPAEEVKVE